MLFILLVLSAIAYSESAVCHREVCRLGSDLCGKLVDKQVLFEKCFANGKYEQLIDQLYDNKTVLTIGYGTDEEKSIGKTKTEQLEMYQKINQFYFGYTVLKFVPTTVTHTESFYFVNGTFKLESAESGSFVSGHYDQIFTANFNTVEHIIQVTEIINTVCKLDEKDCHQLASTQNFFENSFREGDFERLIEESYDNNTVLKITYGINEETTVGTTKEEQLALYQKIFKLFFGYTVLKFSPKNMTFDGEFYVVEGAFTLQTMYSSSSVGGNYYQKFNSNFITVKHVIQATKGDSEHKSICDLESAVCQALTYKQNKFENYFRDGKFEQLINELYDDSAILQIGYYPKEETIAGSNKQAQLIMFENIQRNYPGYSRLTILPTNVTSAGKSFVIEGTFKLQSTENQDNVQGIYYQKFNSAFWTVEHKIEVTLEELFPLIA